MIKEKHAPPGGENSRANHLAGRHRIAVDKNVISHRLGVADAGDAIGEVGVGVVILQIQAPSACGSSGHGYQRCRA